MPKNKLETPINKGNYSFDTEEREQLFNQYRAESWEKKYYQYREDWVNNAKEQKVSEWPLLVDFELSSTCNLKCPMCYTISDEFKAINPNGFMDFELFKKGIDEIVGHVPAIRLSYRGECTLHPQFMECLEYAKSKGIPEVSLLTNSSMLTKEFFTKIAKIGLEWITISIDGINETYEKIRYPLKFQDTLQKVKDIKAIKDSLGLRKPVIKIQTIWPAIESTYEEYYNIFAPYVDLIAYNPLQDGKIRSNQYYEDNFSCPQIYQRIMIGSDGTFIMCCIDTNCKNSLGNFNKETIYDVWHGIQLSEVREKHKNQKYKEIAICKTCTLALKMKDLRIH